MHLGAEEAFEFHALCMSPVLWVPPSSAPPLYMHRGPTDASSQRCEAGNITFENNEQLLVKLVTK